ncbi:MAG: trypsin-like peptidase domain-containing protein [Planctomycetaceae bacterium]|nr:trypsin-like peptidase domain-containing protein [Planctomycetaceae bacterium]
MIRSTHVQPFLLVALVLLAFNGSVLAAKPVEIPEALRQAERERIETMQQAAPAVVAIFDPSGKGGGSGVVISPDGYTVTNFHVVAELGPFMKCGLNDGKLYDAVIIGIDPTGDVAVIRLLGRDDFPVATVGDSDTVRVGDMTFAMGNPFLLATDFQPTVTYGMVSGTHRYQFPAGTFLEYTDCIQVDASINPGNSGGPLFNADGELIGINGRISVEDRGRRNVGAGYAISINQVMNFLDHLKSGRIVDHATLGATVQSNSDGSVVVSNVLETSEAYRRGLRVGDELISFAGRPVRSVNQFKNILGIYPKGWTVPLSYSRENERFNVTVQLMALHRRAELVKDEVPDQAPDQDPDAPKIPLPEELHKLHEKKPEIPEEYASLWEERAGFANYAVNVDHRERILKTLDAWGDFSKQPEGWAIVGKLSDGKAADIRLQPTAVAAKLGESFAVQPLDQDFQDQPPGTGGLLAAIFHLRKLLTDPDNYFTEFYYLGSEPLGGTGPRTDVIIATKGLTTSRFFFNQQSGEFVGFDMSLEETVDPCRIRFGPLKSTNGISFPETLTVEHAGDLWDKLTVDSLQFFAPDKKPEEAS